MLLTCDPVLNAVAANYVNDELNQVVAPSGATLEKGLDYVIDHIRLDVSSIAGGATALWWQLCLDANGAKQVTRLRSDAWDLASGSTVEGGVVATGPRVHVPTGTGLFVRVKTDVGTCLVRPYISLHRAPLR